MIRDLAQRFEVLWRESHLKIVPESASIIVIMHDQSIKPVLASPHLDCGLFVFENRRDRGAGSLLLKF
jgi:hypothetical protein